MVQISHRCASIVFTVLFVLAGIVLAVVPLGLWIYWDDTVYKPNTYSKLALLVASCFLGVTLPISLWDIVMHLRYMHTPLLQVPIVRVLWMVPIYSVDSWLALRFSLSRPQVSMYICVARECYEAFVVYNFFLYLARYVAITAVRDRDRRRTPRGQGSFEHEAADAVHGDSRGLPPSDTGAGSETVRPAHGVPDDGSSSYVLDVSRASSGPAPSQVGEGGGESVNWQRGAEGLADVRRVEARIKFLLARKPPIQHIWPLTQLLRPWSTASSAHHASCEYYRRVKGGVTQYVVVKLAGALVAFVLKPLNLWGEGSLDPLTGFFWVANATNLSQGWALYCLMLFFKGLRHELAPMKPLGKFMAVKALVFFSFWQSLGIAVLVNADLVNLSEICDNCQPAQLAAATQDFLICIEMLVFSMVHHGVFSYRQFAPADTSDASMGPGSTPGGEAPAAAASPHSAGGADGRDFTRAVKAMIALDDVWSDTRGTLEPMLPRKPYPVMRVPPPLERHHRPATAPGRRSRGTSRAPSDSGESLQSGAHLPHEETGSADAGAPAPAPPDTWRQDLCAQDGRHGEREISAGSAHGVSAHGPSVTPGARGPHSHCVVRHSASPGLQVEASAAAGEDAAVADAPEAALDTIDFAGAAGGGGGKGERLGAATAGETSWGWGWFVRRGRKRDSRAAAEERLLDSHHLYLTELDEEAALRDGGR